MKALLTLGALLVASAAFAGNDPAPAPSAPSVLQGKVLEVKDVESYTYLRIKTKNGEAWAAIGKAQVKTGSDITIEHVTVMKNFESRSLKRTFETIYFGQPAGVMPQYTSKVSRSPGRRGRMRRPSLK